MSLLAPYTNRELFSEHFLTRRLRELPAWEAAKVAAAPLLFSFRELLQKERKKLPKYNEEQLRHHWLDPIFAALGAVWDPEPALPTDAASLAPDYLFFDDEGTRTEAHKHLTVGARGAYFTKASVISDAKRWGTPFTAAAKGQKSPRQQLNEYVLFSGVDWGVLTDGAKFRLTHRSVAGKLDRFYEVDLIECLDSPNDEHFLWFFLFCSPLGWRRGPDGRLLDRILEGSVKYAKEVGAGLADSVYETLEIVARGFIRKGDSHPLPELRGECLTLLYRLLFLFYAEDRELLPVTQESYVPYSLRALAGEVAAHLDAGKGYSRNGSLLWGKLKALFDIVDEGDAHLGIPPYNGGLFEPEKHPLLAITGPGDEAVAQAIDLLARTRSAPRERIDYRDLDIRHLGTIYEGLLEYRLKVAEQEKRIVTDRKGLKKVVNAELEEVAALPESERVHKGELYAVTDNEERHVTGSFYTPDYIVEHVVQEALTPLVAGKSPVEILRLRVLDPAMGSGHFLLAAVDFLAQAYSLARIETGEDEDGLTSDDELAQARRLVVEHCIYGVDLNPMAVELAKLALWLATMAKDRPLTFLNLHLRAGNALVGIPVAKVGALASVRNGRRARRVSATDQNELPLFGQKFRGRLPVMINDILAIFAKDTRTKKDIKDKENYELTIEHVRAPFIDVADVQALLLMPELVAEVDAAVEQVRPIGKVADEEKERAQNARLEFGTLVELIETPDKLFNAKTGYMHPLLKLARRERVERRWLHWELVFPEAFSDAHGQPRLDAGFDAVIGNPPWIRQESLQRDKSALEALYPNVFHGVADIYVFFVAAGMQLLAKGGRLGFVLPNKWLKADYAEGLRTFLTEKCKPLSLVDFGHAPVFPDADTFPCILSATWKDDAPAADLQFAPVSREDLTHIEKGVHLTMHVRERRYPVASKQLRPEGWYPVPPEIAVLMAKIQKNGTPLEKYTGHSPIYGLKTGFNNAFYFDDVAKNALVHESKKAVDQLFKPFLRGANLERWRAEWANEWMLVIASSENVSWPWSKAASEEAAEVIFEATFPAIHGHLKKHEAALRAREDQGRFWWELRSCDYYALLEKPKVVYQEISFHSCFSNESQGFYLNNMVHFIPGADSSVLATLSSRLLWWFLSFAAPKKKDDALALHGFLIAGLPIAKGCGGYVDQLAYATASRQARTRSFLDWLRLEMELPKASQRLQSFWRLSDVGLARELKKAGLKLTSAALARVRDEFVPAKAEVLATFTGIRDLERATQQLVYDAYGLTPEEVALVERTLPPRDPMQVLDQEFVPFED